MKTWQTAGNYHRPVTLNHQARRGELMEKLNSSRTSSSYIKPVNQTEDDALMFHFFQI